QVVGRIREGHGPWFFEVSTYRWREHVGPGSDYRLGYRDESECEPWIAADPVRQLAAELPTRVRAGIEKEVHIEISEALTFAETSPFPDASELMMDIYQEGTNALASS